MTDPTPQTTTPTRDEAVPFPAYGELPFAELGSAVKAAQYGAPEPYPFDPEFFPGHQVFGPINFNSLNRIVTWFVKRALASAPAPASGGVDAVARRAKYLLNRLETDDGLGIGEIDTMLRMAASLSPAATPEVALCEDEGCPHHGRPHICTPVTAEMVTAAMRAFEPLSTVLRYREKDGWHACDQMAMRAAIEAALAAKTEKSNGCA